MKLEFVNREAELRELDAASRKGGLLVVDGRRRVGKTRLLRHWLEARAGLYSQAIEAHRDVQVQQVFADLRSRLDTKLEPRSWGELLEVLTLQKKPWSLCIDELPYLVASDASLPSVLQKWLDHSMPARCLLIVAGSSTRMMNDMFLHRAAPLYGRASKLLHVRPMDYSAFCTACRFDPADIASFEKFSCVGGIPRYWELIAEDDDVLAVADSLYFDFAPYMEEEPRRSLSDEGVTGLGALSVLECVGRGAARASEIATRLGTPQSNLSRLLQQLVDASILARDLPFGESLRTTKRTLYRIADPAMRFWYQVRSPHQSTWRTYDKKHAARLVHDHAATVFEDWCRSRIDGAQRYWEGNVELDLVAPDPRDAKGLLVAEIKFRHVRDVERRRLLSELEDKWSRCSLAKRWRKVRFDVLDAGQLASRD